MIAVVIIASGISVYATIVYTAGQVSYSKEGVNGVSNVAEALNDLYNKQNNYIKDTFTFGASDTYKEFDFGFLPSFILLCTQDNNMQLSNNGCTTFYYLDSSNGDWGPSGAWTVSGTKLTFAPRATEAYQGKTVKVFVIK